MSARFQPCFVAGIRELPFLVLYWPTSFVEELKPNLKPKDDLSLVTTTCTKPPNPNQTKPYQTSNTVKLNNQHGTVASSEKRSCDKVSNI